MALCVWWHSIYPHVSGGNTLNLYFLFYGRRVIHSLWYGYLFWSVERIGLIFFLNLFSNEGPSERKKNQRKKIQKKKLKQNYVLKKKF